MMTKLSQDSFILLCKFLQVTTYSWYLVGFEHLQIHLLHQYDLDFAGLHFLNEPAGQLAQAGRHPRESPS